MGDRAPSPRKPRRRLSQAAAAIVAALIGAAVSLYIAHRRSDDLRGDLAELRQVVQAQSQQIQTLIDVQKSKDAEIADLKARDATNVPPQSGLEQDVPPGIAGPKGPSTRTPSESSAAPDPARAADTVVKLSFEFTKPTCRLRGDVIKCTFKIKNLAERQRHISLVVASMAGEPRSFLIDDEGRRYHPVDTEIGGVGRVMFSAAQSLDPDLPVQASMSFDGASGAPASAAISMRIASESDETVIFRNVVVQR